MNLQVYFLFVENIQINQIKDRFENYNYLRIKNYLTDWFIINTFK